MNAKIFSISVILLLIIGSFGSVGIKLDKNIEETDQKTQDDIIPPEDYLKENGFYPSYSIESTSGLPSSFDWRDPQGRLGANWDCTTPIKSQGACGSCWAFATVGVLESAILIKDHMETNLSEQYLVSCNREGWGCDGGYWAHDYHQWKKGANGEEDVGAVLESQKPYQANEEPCDPDYDHPYQIDSWSSIGLLGDIGVPSVDSIKQAIYDHGPVCAAVYSGTEFHDYDGGVFTKMNPGGMSLTNPINHAVILVGWDDNQGSNGVWFLRNSWDTDWGEDKYGNSWDENGDGIQDHEGGYMRIAYGASNIGWGACYIDYKRSGSGEFKIDFTMDEITNDPNSDYGPFEPIDWPESNKPEWYYDVKIGSIHHKRLNVDYSNFADPINWIDAYTWSPGQMHVYFVEDVIVQIEIELWDNDWEFGLYNDQADITKKSGRTFKGLYDLQNDELFYLKDGGKGEKLDKDNEGYYAIKGNYNPDDDKCDNARVRFKIDDNCHIQPNLKTEGGPLSWSNVEPDATKTATISVKNDGDAKSLLDWAVESKPSWVSISPSEGNDLSPSDGKKSLEVTVQGPGQGESARNGEIKIVNAEDSTDFEIIDVSISLSSPPEVPSFTDAPSGGVVGKHIVFSAVTTDPDGDRVAYWFDWDDGSNSGWVDNAGNYYESGSEGGCTHIWNSAGTYDVKVKAKDINGVESGFSDPTSIVINTLPATPDKPYISSYGAAGAYFEFCSSGYDPDSDQVKFGWDWDNDDVVDDWGSWCDSSSGSPAEDCFRHTWNSAGTYYVKVRLKDKNQAKSDWSESLEVVVESNPVYVDAGGPYSGKPDESITFTATASGGFEPYSFAWTFDTDDDFEVEGNPVTHTWNNEGSYYYVRVKVTDDRGQTDIDDCDVTIDKSKAKVLSRFYEVMNLIKNPFFKDFFSGILNWLLVFDS